MGNGGVNCSNSLVFPYMQMNINFGCSDGFGGVKCALSASYDRVGTVYTCNYTLP